ncbi:phosphatase PAP2 family protein [Arcticibacter tournemirensis]|uniref:Phosphatase PAP2 family protein n=1 Tax=Arcticibacter tournemirensis TaxID=699437 RepID=A0A5M9HGC6_9SPHI|nr:phosphatase PAP2 family protein [Arcticibacter tournemirensis]KAA8485583.1 phosphatase PAP2 family protein [Arcticibacter tournemirensis]
MKSLLKLETWKLIIVTLALLLLLLFLGTASHWLLTIIGPADTQLFLTINSHHNQFWDPVMYAASDKFFWFPFYAILIYAIWKQFGKNCWQPLLVIFLLILFTDQTSSHLIKNLVERKRPSHEPLLIPLIHLSKAGPGGLYGFVSSHAANAFAVAVFIPALLKPKKWVLGTLLLWAILVSYSRVYNGVHYPADVLFAILIGSLSGIVFFKAGKLIFGFKKQV